MDIEFLQTYPANIKVVGVGGGGNNTVQRMIECGAKGVEFIAVNTDLKSLSVSKADSVMQIGKRLTNGLGAGAVPEVGEKAAWESEKELRDAIAGADMVFITAGMGGGTGTGAAPVIARIAKELGILTVGIVTKPFPFEGSRRMANALIGIEKLTENVDALITILNANLLDTKNKKLTFLEAFNTADEVLRIGIQSISNIINIPGMINLDFADVSTIMKGSGRAHMGMGISSSNDRALNAAKKAVNSPLLETSITGATGLLINVTGGENLSLLEIDEAVEFIRGQIDPEAEIIFGASIDENMGDDICITLVATGLDKKAPAQESENKAAVKPVNNNPGAANLAAATKAEADIEHSLVEKDIDSEDFQIPAWLRRKNR